MIPQTAECGLNTFPTAVPKSLDPSKLRDSLEPHGINLSSDRGKEYSFSYGN
jgi:hypothetical protein